MKRVFTVIILLFALTLSAAPSLRPDTPREAPAAPSLARDLRIDLYYYSEYENDDWAQKSRLDYTWDENDLAATLQVDTLLTAWQPTYLYTYSYDNLGCNTEILLQDWDNGWVNDWRHDITYNDNNDTTEYFYRQWNGSSWTDYLQILYYYDGTELVREERHYFTRQLDYRCDYAYDAQNRVIEELWQGNAGSGWVNDSRATYEWGDTDISYETWDFWYGLWTHYSQTEYRYNEYGWLTALVASYWVDNDWLVSEMYAYLYDPLGYSQAYTYYAWLEGDEDWTAFWRYEYFWEQFNDIGDVSAPSVQSLQAWPNPFNPVTTIAFNLTSPQQVELAVYNVKGERVATLANAYLAAGEHKIVWNAVGVASGVYFIKLQGNTDWRGQKVILLK